MERSTLCFIESKLYPVNWNMAFLLTWCICRSRKCIPFYWHRRDNLTEIFNTYFSNVASTIGFEDEIVSVEDALQKHSQHPSVLKIKMNTPELPVFNFQLLKVWDVESKLKNIDVKKATGYYKIPGKLLSKAYRGLSVPMTNVLNTCISRRDFLAVLKCAELNPIYKKKDNLAEENYRPVSVLTALSKIYESSLNDQLLQHFITIFNDFLSAYRK